MRFQSIHSFTSVSASDLLNGRAALVVLAPHPDDETLGCGSLLAEAAGMGVACTVICVTDGCRSHPNSRMWPRKKLIALRRQELDNAVSTLGRIVVQHLGYPDCEAPTTGRAIVRISSIVPQRALFLSTWAGDPHIDHQSCAQLAAAVARERPDLRHLAYPVWGRLRPALPFPERGWQLTTRHPAKPTALACHASQMSDLVHDDPDCFTMEPELQRLFLHEPEVFFAP